MYFEKRNHGEEELRRHQRRQDRIVGIKLELEKNVKEEKDGMTLRPGPPFHDRSLAFIVALPLHVSFLP